MYEVRVETHLEAAHQLPGCDCCGGIHGHSYKVTILCRARHLNDRGMVVDGDKVLEKLKRFDHKFLNDLPEFKEQMPTAENLARVICELEPTAWKVELWETNWLCISYTRETEAEYRHPPKI
ncbi:MAG: 6-carboxy-5,6,7,8-tetrahydropterin synthase [Myxococcota bacterium]|nr:6-carboxy-5,6,7,8-tetrahydropterin synthase [Myxococcota bacterium]